MIAYTRCIFEKTTICITKIEVNTWVLPMLKIHHRIEALTTSYVLPSHEHAISDEYFRGSSYDIHELCGIKAITLVAIIEPVPGVVVRARVSALIWQSSDNINKHCYTNRHQRIALSHALWHSLSHHVFSYMVLLSEQQCRLWYGNAQTIQTNVATSTDTSIQRPSHTLWHHNACESAVRWCLFV